MYNYNYKTKPKRIKKKNSQQKGVSKIYSQKNKEIYNQKNVFKFKNISRKVFQKKSVERGFKNI